MFFTCNYCHSKFVHEKNLAKHFCETKKKHLFLKTKKGRITYYYYCEWRKFRGFKICDEKSFINSKFFKSFINFIEFANTKMIPDKRGYIKLMCKKDVSPPQWTNKIFYEYYLENFNKMYSPLKQVEMTLIYLEELAEILQCDVNDVLKNLEVIELIKLISAKKISPWFLLLYNGFKDLIRYRLNSEEKILLESIIDVTHWRKILKDNPDIVAKIKDLFTTLNL